MRRYETFNPTIPETDTSVNEDVMSAPKDNGVNNDVSLKKNKPKKPSEKKSRTRKETQNPSFFQKTKDFMSSQTAKWLLGLFMGFLAVYIAVSFISYFVTCVADQSEITNTGIGLSGDVANAGGEGGARLSEFLINECFGLGSFVIIVWLFAMALKQLVGKPRFKSVNFTVKCLVALITLSLIVGLVTIGMQSSVNWGGYHGRYVNEFVIHFLGWTGAVILCIFMICCFVLICMRDVVKWIMKVRAKRLEIRRIKEAERRERLEREREIEEMRHFEDTGEPLTNKENNSDNSDEDLLSQMVFDDSETGLYANLPDIGEEDPESYAIEDSEDENPDETGDVNLPETYVLEETENAEEEEISIQQTDLITGRTKQDSADDIANSQENMDGLKDTAEGDENGDNIPMVVNTNTISQVTGKTTKNPDFSPGSYPYKFPPFDILRAGEVKVTVDAEEQLENKERIKHTLLDFDIPITSIEATIGPTVTLYEIVPDKGVRVAKIRSLVDDIALSLAAEGVRIIAPIPGKGTVGIEVANKDPQTVSMRTVLKSKKYQESKYQLPLAVGSTISNEVFIADLAKMPHLLVAGATGQGKSVGLNAIIASLLYNKRPDELKFVMVDPKQVEFSLYAKIESHYLAKIPGAEDSIITDMDKVVATLSSLCIEMDNRYQLLKEAHARNIIEYNEKIKEKKLNPLEGHRYLPYIVVIVDEFSDLIMTAGKEVEVPIARLAQKARAVGMHVIIATQRPSTNVITGIIKANFPARMAFKVSSGVDSKTILDTTGAQQLIGRGDMLISNSGPMTRVQCAFIDTPEVESIVDYIARQPYADGAYILPEPLTGKSDGEGAGETSLSTERDPLFEEVARLVVTSNNASTSSLQRRYSIGYNRAGKIMDQLEAAGIVGPAQGGKPRAVLMDPISLDLLLDS
ncbi:MAG: DNA translocase FtsK [Muribaculaceae bacterium]|nr:DNA translocase FtsK [Muribaculaceae bacterium]